MSRLGQQPGFTLIEVLVTMALVAIGLTGNYALTTHSLQQHSAGLYQSRAVILADSLLAALRAGRAMRSTLISDCGGGDLTACRSLQWRDAQYQFWQLQAGRQLPSGAVTLSSAGAAQTEVIVSWRDPLSVHRERYALQVQHD